MLRCTLSTVFVVIPSVMIADSGMPLTEERFTALQNAALDPRFHEYTWRRQQNWVGKDHGCPQQIDFIPPRPEDVPHLMRGLIATVAKCSGAVAKSDADGGMGDSYDPVVLATAVSFGFVFIHPFMDGTKRTAFASTLYFLQILGHARPAKLPEDKVIRFCPEIAEESLRRVEDKTLQPKTIADIAAWFRQLLA